MEMKYTIPTLYFNHFNICCSHPIKVTQVYLQWDAKINVAPKRQLVAVKRGFLSQKKSITVGYIYIYIYIQI